MLSLGCKSGDGISVEQVLKADHFINANYSYLNTLRTESFKLFKRPFPGFF